MMDPNYYNDQYDSAGQYARPHEVMDDREYYESEPQYYSEGETSGDSRRAASRDEEYYSQSNPSYPHRGVPHEDSEYYSQSNPSYSRRGVPREDSEYYSQSNTNYSRPISHEDEEYYSQSNPSGGRGDQSYADDEYYSQSNPHSDYYTEGGTLGESHLDSSRIDRSRVDDNMNFNYDDDNDPHLPPIEERVIDHTEAGEYHGDIHDTKISIPTRVYFYVLCAAMNSCNLGYDIGISAGAAKRVQSSMDLSGVQVQLFMQSVNLFAMMGALCSHFISDNLGRLRTFQIASVVFILGVVIVCSAPEFYTLIFGRLFVGLGVGFGLGSDPMYIAEISPAAHRGQLVTWCDIAMNVGIINGFLSNLIFSHMEDDQAWRGMVGMGMILPFFLVILSCCCMPESPRWLVTRGRDEEAAIALERIYPPGYNVNYIVTEIGDTLDKEYEAEHAYGWDVILFPTPAFRRMLLVGFGCAIAQQAVGIDAIQYFLIFIIDEAGIKTEGSQYAVLIFLGLVKLSFVFIAAYLIDTKGRRPLIFVSLGGMAIALLVNSMNWMAQPPNVGFAIFAVCLYFITYSIGIGPGTWLIITEVFSTSIRAKALSVSTFLNRVISTIVTSTFLSVASAMTWAGFFFLQTFVCLIVAIFFFVYLPEFKGRPLEDASLYFAEITNDRAVLEIEKVLEMRERDLTAQSVRSMRGDSRVIDGSVRIEASGTMA